MGQSGNINFNYSTTPTIPCNDSFDQTKNEINKNLITTSSQEFGNGVREAGVKTHLSYNSMPAHRKTNTHTRERNYLNNRTL